MTHQKKRWKSRFLLGCCGILFAALWLVLIAASWSQADDTDSLGSGLSGAPTPARASAADDEYDFSWLDPEKKIYVLQNRKYQKSQRVLLSVMGGPGLSNSYRNTLNVDPRMAYYFNENFGFEAFYTKTFNSENNSFKALTRAVGSGVIPVVREIRSQYGALLHWAPWYAKINMFNQILYFDWYFAAGAGSIQSAVDTRRNGNATANYVNKELFALFLGTGQQFHLSREWVVRLDFTGAFYQAPIYGLDGEKTWFSNFNFGLGIGYRF